jgi:hypothetical protein
MHGLPSTRADRKNREQSAFSPANVVPGISHSPDKMLQFRIFSYAHRYRLGVNYESLPVSTEPAQILTHFESDYGAAPKVEMKVGQACTNLVPDFASKKWVGFDGTIVGNPSLDICRTQIDVRIHGDSAALLEEMKGFHWMTSYGSYLRETGYALKKAGVNLLNINAPKIDRV